MFEPITKRTKQVVRPDTVGEIVRIAFKYAESEKPGACHIDLPVNIARMPVGAGERPLKRVVPPVEYPDAEKIAQAAQLISEAKAPVILVGASAVRSKASAAITEFVDEVGIPVVTTMMAKGIVSWQNPMHIGTVGITQQDYPNEALDEADLIIAIGYDLVEYSPGKWNHQRDRKIIHIDSTAANINKLYEPVTEVVGDISDAMKKLKERVHRTSASIEVQNLQMEELIRMSTDDSFPLKPQRIINDIRSALDPEDILISDVGAHKVWVARQYPCYRPNTCIISNGFATMGIAVPGAIGAKMVYPEKKILAVTGDGGFMMNSQEIETSIRIGRPIVILIFNDASYGLIKWKQMDRFGEGSCVDFDSIDYVKYAEAFGAKGYRIESADQLLPVLKEAFELNQTCIIDCPVDYSENVKLTQKLAEK